MLLSPDVFPTKLPHKQFIELLLKQSGMLAYLNVVMLKPLTVLLSSDSNYFYIIDQYWK